jgi:hypothetical protein
MRYKDIRLDNRREYAVNPDAYAQIVALVLANVVCSRCGMPYSHVNPMVMLNWCLDCYCREYKDGLTYLGVLREDKDGDKTHYFLSPRGTIYTSSTVNKDRPSESIVETLRYHRFQVPKEGEYRGQKIEFSWYHWSIHGEVAQDCVLIIEWHNTYFPEYGRHVYICYKDGETVPFNKRKGEHRKLYQQAKTQMEASRPGPYGDYIVRGRHVGGMWESCIYEIVSELASQARSQQHDASE